MPFKAFIAVIKALVSRKYPGVDPDIAFREVLITNILKSLGAENSVPGHDDADVLELLSVYRKPLRKVFVLPSPRPLSFYLSRH